MQQVHEPIPQGIDESWHPYLQPLFDDNKMQLLRHDILPKCRFFPSPENIFKVFSTPIDKIKVVIIGQDPYINPGEATGLAFAVPASVNIPPSLKIIRDEIISEGVERDTYINIDSGKWKELTHWKQQGVFLLNSALTVEHHISGSHVGQWRWFTREVIRVIATQVKPVWMLWGAKATNFEAYISPKFLISNKIEDLPVSLGNLNPILKAPHPAAETYNTSNAKFIGCDHFKLCNRLLKLQGKSIINW